MDKSLQGDEWMMIGEKDLKEYNNFKKMVNQKIEELENKINSQNVIIEQLNKKLQECSDNVLQLTATELIKSKSGTKNVLDPKAWVNSNRLSQKDLMWMEYLRVRNSNIRQNVKNSKFLPEPPRDDKSKE
jgi:hypothetical protein